MAPSKSQKPPRIDFVRAAFDRLESVTGVAHVLIDSEPTQISYSEALGLACEKMGAGTGMLFLADGLGQELTLAASVGVGQSELGFGPVLSLGEGLSGWVALQKEAYVSNDLHADGQFQPGSALKFKRAGALSVPILRNGQLLGVLSFADERPNAFGRADLLMAQAVASSLALGLRCAQLRAEAETSYLAVIRGLANALEAKDRSTQGHSQRIGHFCREVGRAMGFAKERQERLDAAAFLHDIGKIGIPESVLNKPGPLDPAEWTFIRRHPEIGAEILRELPSMAEVATFVAAHHERLDGSGYPFGLKGDAIPLESRIITAADAFDAMVSARPYRKARPSEEAILELRACSGSQFDPEVIACFCDIIASKSPAHFFEEGMPS